MDTKRATQTSLMAVAALLLIAAAPQDKTVVKLTFDKAVPVKYKSTIKTDMDFMGSAMSNTINMAQSVNVVEQKDGWTKVQFKTDDFKMEGDGMMGMEGSMAGVKDVTIDVEVDESGRTRNVALGNVEKLDPMMRQMMTGSMKADQMAGFMGVHFPKEAIGVGSKWAIELDAAQMFDKSEMISSVSGKLPVTYEVVGFEDINGKRNIKLKSTMTGKVNLGIASPAGDMTAVVTMDFATDHWIDVATGILTKSVGAATMVNDFGMGSMTQKLSVKVDRVN